jgi:hypothetical protein
MRKSTTESLSESTSSNRTTITREAAGVVPADTVKASTPLELLISGMPLNVRSPRQHVEVRIIDGQVYATGIAKEVKAPVRETIVQENVVTTVEAEKTREKQRDGPRWVNNLLMVLFIVAIIGMFILGMIVAFKILPK